MLQSSTFKRLIKRLQISFIPKTELKLPNSKLKKDRVDLMMFVKRLISYQITTKDTNMIKSYIKDMSLKMLKTLSKSFSMRMTLLIKNKINFSMKTSLKGKKPVIRYWVFPKILIIKMRITINLWR